MTDIESTEPQATNSDVTPSDNTEITPTPGLADVPEEEEDPPRQQDSTSTSPGTSATPPGAPGYSLMEPLDLSSQGEGTSGDEASTTSSQDTTGAVRGQKEEETLDDEFATIIIKEEIKPLAESPKPYRRRPDQSRPLSKSAKRKPQDFIERRNNDLEEGERENFTTRGRMLTRKRGL